MQRLWSRAPVQSARSFVSGRSTGSNRLARRTPTIASKRRLRIGNSITAFYSSIFAGAAVADAQAKDKRRDELNEKIAAVKEEVSELVNEEKHLLEILSPRYKPFISSQLRQVRQYSTTRNTFDPLVEEQHQSIRNESPGLSAVEEFQQDIFAGEDAISRHSESEENGAMENNDDDVARTEEGQYEADDYDPLTMRAMQKLELKRLAIRFMLRPHIAHDYLGVKRQYTRSDIELPKPHISELVTELQIIRRRMGAIKRGATFNAAEIPSTKQQVMSGRQSNWKLNEQLAQDLALYVKDQMSLNELLLRLSQNIVSTKEPNRPDAFRIMIAAFTRTHQDDLVELLLHSLIPFRFTLSGPLIVSILNYYRKTKNLKEFDFFLHVLQGTAAYKPDLGGLEFFDREIVNGVEVTIPPLRSNNMLIWNSFIIAALAFGQPERADAWVQAARTRGIGDDRSTLSSYLRFYSIRKDWKAGLNVLKRSIAYISCSTFHDKGNIERLITWMICLCDNCEQYEFSDALIGAAIKSGFDKGFSTKQLDITFPYDPSYERWQRAADTIDTQSEDRVTRETWEKCHSFTSIIREKVEHALPYEEDRFARRQEMVNQHSDAQLSYSLSAFDARNEAAAAAAAAAAKSVQNDGIAVDEQNQVPSSQRDSATVASFPSITPNPNVHVHQNEEIKTLRSEIAQLRSVVDELCQGNSKQKPLPREDDHSTRKEPTVVDKPQIKTTATTTTTDIKNKTQTHKWTRDSPQQSESDNFSSRKTQHAKFPLASKSFFSKKPGTSWNWQPSTTADSIGNITLQFEKK